MRTGSNKRVLNLRGFGWTVSQSDLRAPITEPNDAQANALNAIAPNCTAMIAQQSAQGETWMDTLARSIPIIAATPMQQTALSNQVARGKAGLPPIATVAASASHPLFIGAAILLGLLILRR